MMNYTKKNFELATLFFLLVSVSTVNFAHAQPVIEEIDCFPFDPSPLSNVTFIAGINSSQYSIDDVRLIVQECMEDICFINSQNITMEYTYTCCMDFYEAEFTLTQKDSTQIKYHLEILSNGIWYTYNTSFIAISNTINDHINDPKEIHTPGFELLSLLLMIIIVVSYLHRHKNK